MGQILYRGLFENMIYNSMLVSGVMRVKPQLSSWSCSHPAFNFAHLIPVGCIPGRKATCVKVNLDRLWQRLSAGISCGWGWRQHNPEETGSDGCDGNSCARGGIKGLPNKNGVRGGREEEGRGEGETRDLSRERRDNAILGAVISPRRTVIGRTSAHNAAECSFLLHLFFLLGPKYASRI